MPLDMEEGLGPGDFVLDGDPASPPKFSAHVYCSQTAGWIKMVLGMEVGLSPGDFVLDGDPPKFSANVYYSYCYFVRTLHRRKALLACSSSSSSLVFYAFYLSLIHISEPTRQADRTGVRTDRQDRQLRSDSIGRTVLQTVAQKLNPCFVVKR